MRTPKRSTKHIKDTEIIKNTKSEIKNTIIEVTNTIEGINSKLDEAED